MKYFRIDFIDVKCANTTLREDTQSKLEEEKDGEEPALKKNKSKKDKSGGMGETLTSMLGMQKLISE